MIKVKSNKEKYDNNYAIPNMIDYYGYRKGPCTDWEYWTAYGVDASNIEIAKNQMMDTKIRFKHFKGIQMYQVHIQIPHDEINSMFIKPGRKAERVLVDLIGQYFYSNGIQTVSFVYRNKPGIFIRVIVNSTSINSGKKITRVRDFVSELETLLNNFIQTH